MFVELGAITAALSRAEPFPRHVAFSLYTPPPFLRPRHLFSFFVLSSLLLYFSVNPNYGNGFEFMELEMEWGGVEVENETLDSSCEWKSRVFRGFWRLDRLRLCGTLSFSSSLSIDWKSRGESIGGIWFWLRA